jgi:AraC family transcriptional regulator of adaptative response / DNA-3-methyladenine glycosylase II
MVLSRYNHGLKRSDRNMISTGDSEMYYRAMLSRDPRFDGRFFAGVTSTGVYCRPICPAPKPRFKNVIFYASSAAAEREGFRPCKRCRPDASPGTPIWSGTSAVVARALKFINGGYLDSNSVPELAENLGVSDRHLRRLFMEHLGAAPRAVALTRRLDFARKLIDETGVSMTEAAFASGFESIRRFNDAIKKRFGESPSALRLAVRKKGKRNHNRNSLTVKLAFRPPFDWAALLRYLQGRRVAGVETISDNSYCRSIRSENKRGFIYVSRPSKESSFLELTLHTGSTYDLMNIVERVRRIFDLGADPLFITGFLKKDPELLAVIEAQPGLRIPGGWDNFEIAVRTVIGQQVSIPAANTIMARLVKKYGDVIEDSPYPGITHLFPTAGEIAGADLANIGIPKKRALTIRTMAGKVAEGEIVLEGCVQPEIIKAKLLEIPGIGAWTTEYIAMRALREPDAFPGTDLAIKRELHKMEQTGGGRMEGGRRPEVWRPWRAYAAMYLWKKYTWRQAEQKR